jgi:hypothetical protein
MKIHSNILQRRDFHKAAFEAGVTVIELEVQGSRSRSHAFHFSLTGSSPFNRGFGAEGKAATWDEWGIFLAELFVIDPNAHCGKNSYQSEDHFNWVTGNRFKSLVPNDQHTRHRWGLGQPSASGTYSVAQCECGAIHRWFINPNFGWKEWQEFCGVA